MSSLAGCAIREMKSDDLVCIIKRKSPCRAHSPSERNRPRLGFLDPDRARNSSPFTFQDARSARSARKEKQELRGFWNTRAETTSFPPNHREVSVPADAIGLVADQVGSICGCSESAIPPENLVERSATSTRVSVDDPAESDHQAEAGARAWTRDLV